MLTIKGEKKHEKEEKGENYYLAERSFGSFERSIRLPDTVDESKIEAKFDKGVLKVTAAKKPEAVKAERKIEIKKKPSRRRGQAAPGSSRVAVRGAGSRLPLAVLRMRGNRNMVAPVNACSLPASCARWRTFSSSSRLTDFASPPIVALPIRWKR